MPTKKKRVGFIPREDVMRLIDKLSIENNLSNSKIISILVEEALSIRGIFNKKSGRVTQSYQQSNNDNSKIISDNYTSFTDKTGRDEFIGINILWINLIKFFEMVINNF